MSKAQHTFKQGDVTKAIKATVNAGLSVKRVELNLEKRQLNIIIGDAPPSAATGNEWDDVR